MRKLGIDASTTAIGFAYFDGDKLVNYGKLTPSEDKMEWRERIQDFARQIQDLINRYEPELIIQEDVPLMKKQLLTLVQLGSVQGMMLTVSKLNKIPIEFIPVATWRKARGILKGELDRDAMKIKSIELANDTFNINLRCEFTKNGKYAPNRSDDDVADAINVCASTIDKYKVEVKTFGRR